MNAFTLKNGQLHAEYVALSEIAARFGVRSIPTLMIFKNGEVADIKVGAAPKTALASWIGSAA